MDTEAIQDQQIKMNRESEEEQCRHKKRRLSQNIGTRGCAGESKAELLVMEEEQSAPC